MCGMSFLLMKDTLISGHGSKIKVRVYRPVDGSMRLPIVLYFHGGGFTSGSLDWAAPAATCIAERVPACVISVGYSLAPEFPFPVALEDGYCALKWARHQARHHNADARRIALAGHDAGGNLATCLAAMVRDRQEFALRAQVMIAPLLDPSLTCSANELEIEDADLAIRDCAQQYRAYLPNVSQRIHPYAAPIESSRLGGLPPALIAVASRDLFRAEAERYAGALTEAGVSTQIIQYGSFARCALGTHMPTLTDVACYLQRHLSNPI